MTPSDDEVVARLRASFQATAARTPIGTDRLAELTVVTTEGRSRPLLVTMSAAAAVAAIAATAAVVSQSGGSHRVSPASGSGPSGAQSAAHCNLQNYYVIAPRDEIEALTYLLPSTPAGYTMYGAWGTIDRSMCPGTANWYVEYDDANGYANSDNKAIQLQVTPADSLLVPTTGPVAGIPATVPAASVTTSPVPRSSEPADPGSPVTVDGVTARFYDGKAMGTLTWTKDGLRFQLNGPLTGQGPASLVSLAESLVHVSADDARIKAPANCQVPAGQVCPG